MTRALRARGQRLCSLLVVAVPWAARGGYFDVGSPDEYIVNLFHEAEPFVRSQRNGAELGFVFDEHVPMVSAKGREGPTTAAPKQASRSIEAVEVLEPFRDRCFLRNEGFWTYQVCPFRDAKQFRGTDPDDDEATAFSLGRYDPGGDEVLTATSGDVMYIQRYRGGDDGRSAELRFVCQMTARSSFVKAVEPTTHAYQLTVHTPLLCDLGGRPEAYLASLQSQDCLTLRAGWWTYELCYRRHIRQYHAGKDFAEHFLGRFRPRFSNETMLDLPLEDALDRPARKGGEKAAYGGRATVFSQTYVNGSVCDLTGAQREASVRFVCGQGKEARLVSVRERATCSYRLVVVAPQLCAHPAFQDVEEDEDKEKRGDPLSIDCVAKDSLSGAALRIDEAGLVRNEEGDVVSLAP